MANKVVIDVKHLVALLFRLKCAVCSKRVGEGVDMSLLH